MNRQKALIGALTAVACWMCLGALWLERPDLTSTDTLQGVGENRGAARARRDPFVARPTWVDAPVVGEVSRRVLALYDSTETFEEEDDYGRRWQRPVDSEVALVHRLLELPLNYLGYAVDYHDVARGDLPSRKAMRRYRAVLTWFDDDRMPAPRTYLRWLAQQSAAGRRLIVLERLGALYDSEGKPTASSAVAQAMTALGGTYLGNWTDSSEHIEVLDIDRDMMAFEQPLPHPLPLFVQYRAARGNQVHLRLSRRDRAGLASDVVWTGPTGGFAMASTVFSEEKVGERWVSRWILNPFHFLRAALSDRALWPRPDLATRGGRRIWFSHIDGDGMEHQSGVRKGELCGDVVREEILSRYDLPFTSSVVVGNTAPPPLGRGNDATVGAAQRVFSLSNVEVGSHGLAHPMDWRAGTVAGYSAHDLGIEGLTSYPPESDLVGRAEAEIRTSIAYIENALAPPEKPCRIMLWTGWCNPTEEQLAVAYRLGLRNINGGDPRMDAQFPSYAHLVAPVHQVGRLLQFYTPAANDYILTDEWTPPYYRFRNVIETFKRSGEPRRVLPINVYFHFYAGEHPAAMRALREVLDWSLSQPIAPIFASTYVDIVRDFHFARIGRVGGRAWRIRKGTALRTVRFDGMRYVDLNTSRGVLGYAYDAVQDVTYVHLDGTEEAFVALGARPPTRPYVIESSHALVRKSDDTALLALNTEGIGPRFLSLGGLEPMACYRLDVEGSGPSPPLHAQVDGTLAFQIDVGKSQQRAFRLVGCAP